MALIAKFRKPGGFLNNSERENHQFNLFAKIKVKEPQSQLFQRTSEIHESTSK
jgi:hypothetical protein